MSYLEDQSNLKIYNKNLRGDKLMIEERRAQKENRGGCGAMHIMNLIEVKELNTQKGNYLY